MDVEIFAHQQVMCDHAEENLMYALKKHKIIWKYQMLLQNAVCSYHNDAIGTFYIWVHEFDFQFVLKIDTKYKLSKQQQQQQNKTNTKLLMAYRKIASICSMPDKSPQLTQDFLDDFAATEEIL